MTYDAHAELADRHQGRPGQWMQTYSGRRFFPLDPHPNEVSVNDIANCLAMTCRYGGHLPPERYYSVAEHCALMYLHGSDQGDYFAATVALFHDAAEAYVGDLPRAIKAAVGDAFKEIEHKVQGAIWEHLGLRLNQETEDIVKDWDRRMIKAERAVLFQGRGQELEWAHDVLEPLPVKVRCLQPAAAKRAFILCYWDACQRMGWDPEEIEV